MRYFLLVRPDELFADDSEVFNVVRCLARGYVAFYTNGTKTINAVGKQAGQGSGAFVGQ